MKHTRDAHRRTAAVAVLAGLALMAAGCSSGSAADGDASPSTVDEEVAAEDGAGADDDDVADAVTEPVTWTVDVDGELDNANVTINGYVPTDLVVRPGDTVEFAFQPGDAHTVSFGTLVDAALAAGPGGPDGPSPEFEALPEASTLDGEPVHTGLAPCYSDAPPDDGAACEQQEQPEFRGDLALYSSGAFQPGATFTMEIAEDIEPGDYGYLCLIHGFPMTGTLTVAEPGQDIRSADEVEQGKEPILQSLADTMQDPVDTLGGGDVESFFEQQGVFTDGDDATVVASSFGGPRSYYIEILEFGPTEVEIQTGQTVRWHFQNGGHTISFNPTPDATPYIVPGDDGLPTVNELATAAQGGATPIPPRDELVPDPQPDSILPATVIDAGEWDGQGFFSSGITPAFAPVSYDITFTEPGTYAYQCLIHEGMTGTVTVTG